MRVACGVAPRSRDPLTVDARCREHRVARLARQVAGVSLTPREIEVVAFMREGFTNNEIGRLLGISTHTAKAHVAGVIEKLGAGDRTQAVARAFDLGCSLHDLREQPPAEPSTKSAAVTSVHRTRAETTETGLS